ncbi:chlorophyll a/b-binding protein [Prochlorococcus marinus]|uniref:Possible high light inducible protein n=1 Tax=Prochlorococcus marinus (strain MIT 9211) TaxID=93059 RepID=A9B9C6_PROM4|nr:chlorophyll a/b-binding protein [Prochlorococcus marinus]ABX08003.1 possible high light inducible protein [Prochlorococcus marinus str. MIT 9211]
MPVNSSNFKEEDSSLENTESPKDSPNETQPLRSASSTDVPSFGWSEYAERANGRFAMVGFLAILLIEIISRTNFLQWAGFVS